MEISTNSEIALTSTATVQETKYDVAECLSSKQLAEYWDLFPYSIRKSCNKARQGLLSPVSDEELKVKITTYLTDSSTQTATSE